MLFWSSIDGVAARSCLGILVNQKAASLIAEQNCDPIEAGPQSIRIIKRQYEYTKLT